MKLGVTGHQDLDDPAWVGREMARIIGLQPRSVIGVTSLAMGADQLFAQAILDCGGMLHIIVPCADYRNVFDAVGRVIYERLLMQAAAIEVLPRMECTEEAYLLAGKTVVDLSNLIIAVWNGKPAVGLGGTGDVVKYVKLQGKPFIHINPVTHETVSNV